MAHSFLPVDRDQRFLLPVDMREWLDGDHLVWFIIEVVGRLDLSGLREAYRLGGAGRRAYDPEMLLALLVYALSQGVRSSRRIEGACRSDVAYRVICGTWAQTPDHATLCRFRRRHQAAIEDLFCQVLALARGMGMARVGLVAVDGSKVRASASMGANRSEGWLREEVRRMLEEAEETDRLDEEELGDETGWELPPHLDDTEKRSRRLEEALEALSGRRGSGETDPKVNLTDPDSRMMAGATGGFLQGYNCQVAVTEDGMVAAARATNRHNDMGQLSQMVEAVETNLAAGGGEASPQVVVADAGYCDSADLGGIEADPEAPLLLVATDKSARQPAEAPPDPEALYLQETEQLERQDQAIRRHRSEVMRRWEAGELDHRQAASQLGLSVPRTYVVRAAWREGGTAAIPVPKRRRPTRPTPAALVRYRLQDRLADPANRRLFRRRSHLAETPFAEIKHHRGLNQFTRRGLEAVNAEFLLECLVYNLLRIRQRSGGLLPNPT